MAERSAWQHPMSILAIAIVNVVIGGALVLAMTFQGVDAAAPFVDIFKRGASDLAAIAAISIFIVAPLVAFILWRFFRNAIGTLNQIVTEVFAAVLAQKNGDTAACFRHLQLAGQEGFAWYAPIATRRWMLQAALGLLIALAGLFGTVLVFRQTLLMKEQNAKLIEQTGLLRDQNEKLDIQTVVAETAQRRAMLAPELFLILQAISRNDRELLSSIRIETFSQSATPYFSMEVIDQSGARVLALSKQQKSSERGQLLVALASAKLSIPSRAVFSFAELSSARMSDSDLDNAQLSNAYLDSAHLESTTLRNAVLFRTSFRGAEMKNADLSGAQLYSNDFFRADLTGAKLVGLRGPKPLGSNEIYADFGNATLIDADFSNTTFSEDTEWNYAAVGRPQLDGALPIGFPKGWSSPPAGWKTIVDDDGIVRLVLIDETRRPPARPRGWSGTF